MDVLVADDVEEIQLLVEHWLTDAGHRVVRAANGREVLRLLREGDFDLLVMDVLMPDGDGLEVLTAMKREHRPLRVLAISGGGLHLPANDCLRFARGLGAHAALLKPFRREQFLAAVDQVMAKAP